MNNPSMLTCTSAVQLRSVVDVAAAARVDVIDGHELQRPAHLVDQLDGLAAGGRETRQDSAAAQVLTAAANVRESAAQSR